MKPAKGYETKVFTTSSLLISTSAMVTDAILGTSETQRTVKAIDKMIRMKATLNARIDNDLVRFKYAQTAENARYVIADIMLLKSYQILGEQYALAYYEQQINKRAEWRDRDIQAWFAAGNAPSDYDIGAAINEIYTQALNEAEKIRDIVRLTNISIDSFEFPFNETKE